MPKTKTKKRKSQTHRAAGTREVTRASSEQVAAPRSVRSRGSVGLQNVVFAAMVALGFLGMAIFFAFFYGEDPNHYIYAALAGLTGVGWVALLVRRWSQYRQSASL
jgi:hypothetical protein